MRLLLTSEGIYNAAIKEALLGMTYRPVAESRVAFVPTSANRLDIDKRFLLLHLRQLERMKFKTFDIVDIAAVPVDMARDRLASADVIVFGGGNGPDLLAAIDQFDLRSYLPELLTSRVYVGISAGSMVTGPDVAMSDSSRFFEPDGHDVDAPALGLTGVRLRPHHLRPDNPQVTPEKIQAAADSLGARVYGVDDDSALTVIDGEVGIVGSGNVVIYEPK